MKMRYNKKTPILQKKNEKKKKKKKKEMIFFFIITIFFLKCAMVKSFKAFFILLTISIPLKFDYKDILKKVVACM